MPTLEESVSSPRAAMMRRTLVPLNSVQHTIDPHSSATPHDPVLAELMAAAAGPGAGHPRVAAVMASLQWLLAGCLAHAGSRIDDGDSVATSAAILDGDLCFAIADRLVAHASPEAALRESGIIERFCVAALHHHGADARDELLRRIVYSGAVDTIDAVSRG